MIVFELSCSPGGHRFEGWFASSDDYAGQQARGLVTCPECGSAQIAKAPMAPAVPRKGNQQVARPQPDGAQPPAPQARTAPDLPPAARAALLKIAELQAEALKHSRWVGKDFAEDARAMHYGEKEAELIHGEASAKEAQALAEEGIVVAPVLFPIAPPGKVN
jgi:hypothetical protein